RMATDVHFLQINDEDMDKEGRLLVNRLVMAAASPDVRREMQVEDEILSEIEARDTAIMMKDKEIELKTQEIEQKSQEIEQKSQEIEQQKSILRTTVRNLSQRSMSVKDIASVLAVSEETVSALLSE
ncbi:MAG TPA: hypothetical protein H9950_10920, partial [Candidatus Bacteroides avicola]|nr:hypothetical protein [Candidatus Bacteroides avicola]